MNIKSLAEILREAAAIIAAIPSSGAPGILRTPIVNELEGFASWVESDVVSRADYDELLLQLNDLKAGIPARDAEIASLRKRNQELQDQFEAIGAGGVKGRLMPGAVSAEPVAWQYFSTIQQTWRQVDPERLHVVQRTHRVRPLYAAPVGNSGPLTLDEKRKILDYNHLPYDPQLAAVINQTEREVLMRTKSVQQDADKVDAERLDWLEEQAKLSRSGISFDWRPNYVEDGQVLKSKGWRFMRRNFLGERKPSIREAIDAARKEAKG